MTTTSAPQAATSPQEKAKILQKELEMRRKPLDVGKFGLAVYGWSGVGKTYLGASSKSRRALFVVVEPTEETLREFQTKRGTYPFDIIDEAGEGKVRRALDLVCALHEAGDETYGILVIDSGTELMKIEMDRLLEERGKSSPDVEEYVEVQNGMRSLLRDFRKRCPIPYIFTFGVSMDKDEKVGNVSHKPGAIGKLAGEIGHYFDAVGVLFVGDKPKPVEGEPPKDASEVTELARGRRPRFIMFEGDSRWATKSRGDSFADVEPADIDALLDKALAEPATEEGTKS